MIVQTLADAQTVAQYVQGAGTARLGSYGDWTRDDVIAAVRNPNVVIIVEPPDGLLMARRFDIALGGFSEVWVVAVLTTQRALVASRTTYKSLCKQLCDYAVSKGKGGVPIAWSQSSQVGQVMAQIVGSPAVRQINFVAKATDSLASGAYFWTTASDTLATGTLG